MRAVSDTFLQTIRGAHKAVFRARVLSPGLTGTNPGPLNSDGSPTNEITILSGDVTFSTGADVNGTLDMTTSMTWPALSSSLGSPYGQEIFVERGIQYGNGTKEWVGLGYFRIDSVEQVNAPKGAIRIGGSDRMANVRDGRAIQPEQYLTGASVGTVLDTVIGTVLPGVTTVYDFSAYTTYLVADHILDQDRLAFVQELVTAYGKVCYFDYKGRFVVKSTPTLANTPVFDINSGRNGVLVSMKRTVSRDGVFNGVVASGEPVGEAPPVSSQVLDLVTSSPTYWFGPFGKVPRFFTSSFLTTVDQCTSAATSLLSNSTGIPYTVNLGVVPNPALEGWDTVRVTYNDKLNPEIHVIDTITYNLGVSDVMGIDTRKQYLV